MDTGESYKRGRHKSTRPLAVQRAVEDRSGASFVTAAAAAAVRARRMRPSCVWVCVLSLLSCTPELSGPFSSRVGRSRCRSSGDPGGASHCFTPRSPEPLRWSLLAHPREAVPSSLRPPDATARGAGACRSPQKAGAARLKGAPPALLPKPSSAVWSLGPFFSSPKKKRGVCGAGACRSFHPTTGWVVV